MPSATVTRMGNSAGVAIPALYRMDGCFAVGESIHVSRPRRGVIVLRSAASDDSSRLARLDEAESRISARSSRTLNWPDEVSAEDVIARARKDRVHGSVSL